MLPYIVKTRLDTVKTICNFLIKIENADKLGRALHPLASRKRMNNFVSVGEGLEPAVSLTNWQGFRPCPAVWKSVYSKCGPHQVQKSGYEKNVGYIVYPVCVILCFGASRSGGKSIQCCKCLHCNSILSKR